MLDTVSAAKINVQEMENVIFEGAEAAIARILTTRAQLAGVFRARFTTFGTLPVTGTLTMSAAAATWRGNSWNHLAAYIAYPKYA